MKTNKPKKILAVLMAFSIIFSNATLMTPSDLSDSYYAVQSEDDNLSFIPPIQW